MKQVKIAMSKAVEFLRSQLLSLHLVGVTSNLLETVKINYYDQQMLISHIAEVTKNANGIGIMPYNPNDVGMIANGLKAAGFDAYVFSKTMVHVNTPKIVTSEHIERFISHVRKLGEDAKLAVRNERKNARKGLEKEELQEIDKDLQKITDEMIGQIDELIHQKIKPHLS